MALALDETSALELEQHWHRYLRFVYDQAGRRSRGHDHLRDDLVGECWLRLATAFARGRPPHQPLPWIRTVIRNAAADYQRKSWRESVSFDDRIYGRGQRRADARAAQVAWVKWAIAAAAEELPTRDRDILDAVFIQGRTRREEAARRHLSPTRISQLVKRALARLRRILEPDRATLLREASSEPRSGRKPDADETADLVASQLLNASTIYQIDRRSREQRFFS